MILAVVNRYMKNDFRPNSLTVIDKYPFADPEDAREFVKNLKRIDRRIISANVEITDL